MRCDSIVRQRFRSSIPFCITLLLVSLAVFFGADWVFAGRATGETSSYILQPGDRLEIRVYREEDLSKAYEVDPSGKLTFPLVGDIQVSGLGIEEFRNELTVRLKKYLVDPQVSVSRSEGTIKSISVLGHVEKPGVYDYAPGASLMRLVSTAGGFTESANKRKIKIVRIAYGEKQTLVINGLDIIDGKRDDPPVEPGDIIFVSESIF